MARGILLNCALPLGLRAQTRSYGVSATGVSYEPVKAVPPRGPHTPPTFRWRGWLIVIASIGIIVGAAWYFRAHHASNAGVQTVRTAIVKRADFVRSLRVHGVVEAMQSYSIAAPRLAGQRGQDYGSLIITKLIPGGTKVQPGDVLVEFDRQNQMKNALDRQADYNDYLEQIKKKLADQAAAAAADATELKQAENAVQAASLELKKNEVVSKIDAEKNHQTLEEAKARLQQLRETFELKKRARQADLHVLEIQRDRARLSMIYAQKNAEKLVIKSRLAGVVVLGSMWRAGTMGEVQEGDSVDAGRPIMQVIDPSAMQVRARVNQADVAYLHEGALLRIGLDAYPELSFGGKVESIGAIGLTSVMSQRVHTFTVLFSVQGSDPRLMPDLSAAVDIELQRVPSVLLAPRDAIATDKSGPYIVVKNGSATERHEVKLGAMSDSEVVIESGIDEGATVLRNPSS